MKKPNWIVIRVFESVSIEVDKNTQAQFRVTQNASNREHGSYVYDNFEDAAKCYAKLTCDSYFVHLDALQINNMIRHRCGELIGE